MSTPITPAAALRRVRLLEDRLAEAWRGVEDAIVRAAEAGQSYSQIGADLGLSKQRVGDLVKAARNRRPVTPDA